MTLEIKYDPEDGAPNSEVLFDNFPEAILYLERRQTFEKKLAAAAETRMSEDEEEMTEKEANQVEQDSHLHP